MFVCVGVFVYMYVLMHVCMYGRMYVCVCAHLGYPVAQIVSVAVATVSSGTGARRRRAGRKVRVGRGVVTVTTSSLYG